MYNNNAHLKAVLGKFTYQDLNKIHEILTNNANLLINKYEIDTWLKQLKDDKFLPSEYYNNLEVQYSERSLTFSTMNRYRYLSYGTTINELYLSNIEDVNPKVLTNSVSFEYMSDFERYRRIHLFKTHMGMDFPCAAICWHGIPIFILSFEYEKDFNMTTGSIYTGVSHKLQSINYATYDVDLNVKMDLVEYIKPQNFFQKLLGTRREMISEYRPHEFTINFPENNPCNKA